jgi:hypothetical protein
LPQNILGSLEINIRQFLKFHILRGGFHADIEDTHIWCQLVRGLPACEIIYE